MAPSTFAAIDVQATVSQDAASLFLTFLPLSSPFKNPCDFVVPAQIIQDNFPVLNLIHNHRSVCYFNSPLSPCHVTQHVHRSGNYDVDSFWGEGTLIILFTISKPS